MSYISSCDADSGYGSNVSDTRNQLCFGTSGADANEPRWFVIQSHPQAERLVARELAEKGYTAFLPMISKKVQDRVVKSMWHIVTSPLFPSYLFVQGYRDSTTWSPVVYTQGVKKLFSSANMRPIPVPRGVIEKFQAEADERMIVRGLPDIEEGAAVTIEEGPFSSFDGVCLWSDDARVKVLANIFGRLTQVTLPRTSVSVK